ncbi:XrtA/PEP-CTERM system TPR-repeat protein PrsT [Zooshikella sp. RANM57]|uniref:XrtA/PEP-CTERM system TPR-repeat protein PrsT n=1 Tax=Zooshikella sp. RANM57 TaxID=3425863 RepID=UPI003D6EB31A
MQTFNRIRLSLCSLCLGVTLPLSGLAADYLKDAQQYYEKGEYKSAEIQLKNLLKENPEDAKARALLGRAYLKQGNLPSAVKEFERAKKLGDLELEDRLSLAELYLLQRRFTEAITLVDLEAIDADHQPDGLLIHGYAYMGQGMYADAREAFEKALKSKDLPSAHLGLAKVDFREGNIDDSSQRLEKLLKKEAENPDALILRAQIATRQERYADAITDLDTVLKLAPENYNALIKRADAYALSNKLDKAKADLDVVLEKVPEHPEANFTLTKVYLKQGEYEKAREAGEKVLRLRQQFVPVMYLLGIAHYGLGNYQQALEQLEQYTNYVKGNDGANILLAQVLVKQKNYQGAITLLEKLAAKDGKHQARVYALLGNAYMKTKDYAKATHYLDKALELEPNIARLQAQVAVGHLFSGDTKSAIKELKELSAKAEEPNDADLLLVRTYIQEKKYKEAETLVTKRIKQWPDNPMYHNLQGLLHQVQGRFDDAKAGFEQALEKDKKYIPALMGLAGLSYTQGDQDAAKDYYQQAIAVNEKYLPAYFALSAVASSAKDDKAALEWLEKAHKANDKDLRTQIMLADAYLNYKRLDDAQRVTRRLADDHGDQLAVIELQTRVARATKDDTNTQFLLEKLVTLSPDNKGYINQLMQYHLQKGDKKAALDVLDAALRRQPTDKQLILTKMRLLNQQKRYDEALVIAKEIVKHEKDSPTAQILLASAYLNAKQDDKAKEIYQPMLADLAEVGMVSRLYAFFNSHGMKNEVEKLFADSLKKWPNNGAIRRLYAQHLHSNGMVDEAIKQYEEILKTEPDDVTSLNNLAWFYLDKKQDKALKYAEKAHKAMPKSPEVADTYGWILLNNDQHKKALEILSGAAKAAPNNFDIRYHYAVALAKTGKKEQAKKELKLVLSSKRSFSEKKAAEELFSEL